MLGNINYQIWYKVCRPLRVKYNLSANCVMILNGTYVLYKITNKPFTRYQLRSFVSYYNPKYIEKYITVLISRNMITLAGLRATRQLYCISELGLQVISELNKSYKDQLYLFCSKYNIEL